jgi:hypothetical protein
MVSRLHLIRPDVQLPVAAAVIGFRAAMKGVQIFAGSP